MTIYKITIKPTNENRFHITWHNVKENTVDSFEQTTDITPEETQKLWQQPEHQRSIGEKLFRFLDGDARHFLRALNEAHLEGEALQLHLLPCQKTADWPFELLAHDGKFLLPHQLHLVRYVSDWGIAKKIPPGNRPLKLLFMACSAMDVLPELDFEQEEEAIFHITEDLPIDMEVEDSGSLEGLRSRLEKEQYDVVHLSGHADIDKHGNPYFIMESETGYHRKIFPGELWEEALIENPPRLLFLSGCRTGEEPDTGAAVSFARMLVEKHHVPAVLGWGRSVADEQAIHAGKMFYHRLSLGKTILKAVQRARYELAKKYESSPYHAWPLLRLFSSGMILDAIVKAGQKFRPKSRETIYFYLKESKVKVLKEGFVGRRRQLQKSLKKLKNKYDKVGILLLGTAGLGKSCLAGKLCERFPHHTLIIVHGKLNAITLEAALKDPFILTQDKNGQQILSQQKEMTDKLANLCVTSFKEKNYLLLLDDFEQNLEGADKGKPGPLLPEAADLLKVLLHYLPFSGKMTRLIITSRYDFSLTEQEQDLVNKRLETVWLTGFNEAELRKKSRRLEKILNYQDKSLLPHLLAAGHGNPRLMERLNVLVGRMALKDVKQLLEAIKDKKEDFIHEHMLRELLCQGGEELSHFLRWFSIYRRPVLEEGVEHIAEKAGSEGWKKLLMKGRSLSLVEHDQVRQTYQMTPLLREELVNGLKEKEQAHEAAFTYYKKICETPDAINPIPTEEWIFHALGCGEEEEVSRQGGNLISYLRENLAFQESRRVGEWILTEKKRHSTGGDADLLNAFGSTVHVLGDYRKAIECFEQALSICKKVYGEKHSNVSIYLNNLGTVWSDYGDHKKAFDYINQALNILMKCYKGRHSDVASTLNNLGLEWQALGHPLKAIDCFNQALFIDRSLHGEMHPTVARDWNNMGSVRQKLGHYREAIDCFNQALFIDRSLHGEMHPTVARDWNNMGSVQQKLGHYQKAVECFEQALTIYKKVYSKKHPDVALQLNNLGSVWSNRGDHKKAFDYISQALDILMEFYEERHPDVASTLNFLGLEWQALGHPLKAIERFEQALFIDRSVYGEMHPTVARDWNNMGLARQKLGHYQEAIKCFEQALTICKKIFGSEHPKTKKMSESLKACQ